MKVIPKALGCQESRGYNGDGLRMSKTVSGTTSQFLWDPSGGLPLLIKDASTAYIYGPGGMPLEQINGTTTLWLHHDQLGSTRLISNAAGSSVATYTFDPYGKLTASTGTVTNPMRFGGQYQDGESGLYYLRARLYDAATGQFDSRDPALASTRAPYAYTLGNPINAADPTGLVCLQFWDASKCTNSLSSAIQSLGSTIHNCTDTAYHAANCVSVPPYAAYYFSYNQLKNSGAGMSPITRNGLEFTELVGLTTDAALDCAKNAIFKNNESIADEGIYASHTPRQFNDKADTFLPGLEPNGDTDFSVGYGTTKLGGH